MIPPADDIDLKPEKLEEDKEGGALFHCDLSDADIVNKIAQEFLPGLASACVDNTTGGIFSNPASVAVGIRREMVDHLIQRSENFVAETMLLDGGPDAQVSEDPYDITSDFIDDFVSSKRNFFSRVSGWLLSERREDWIDDLVQEMEINGFWLLNRRESVAQTILKNIDFKNLYHCTLSFKSPEDLEEHKLRCSFRTMTCTNEGCDSRFSAAQMDHHDSTCPFKILKCEQNCSEYIMRREMDRHCVTICPMKLVKCPFYSVGCHPPIPQCNMDQHRSGNIHSHLLYVLQAIHKEASTQDLKGRVEEICKLSSPGKLAGARDARSLTIAIKDLEAKLGPLKIHATPKPSNEISDPVDKKEENSNLGTREIKSEESPKTKGEESVKSPLNCSDNNNLEPYYEKEKVVEPANSSAESKSQPNNTDLVAPLVVQESLEHSPLQSENSLDSPSKVEKQVAKPPQEEVSQPNNRDLVAPLFVQENLEQSPIQSKSSLGSPNKVEKQIGKPSQEHVSQPNNTDLVAPVFVQQSLEQSPLQSENGLGSPDKVEKQIGKPPQEEVRELAEDENLTSPIKTGQDTSSVSKMIKQEVNQESFKTPPREEHKESSNAEVYSEPPLVKEQTEILGSSALEAEDVKS